MPSVDSARAARLNDRPRRRGAGRRRPWRGNPDWSRPRSGARASAARDEREPEMTTNPARRDYGLVGPETKRAMAMGLAEAEWYRSPIPRARLKEMMQRSDGRAIRDTLIWIAGFIVSGGAGYLLWGTWWAVPCFAAYGVLYGSSSDSRWHECGHRTAFRTQWM